MYIFLYINVCMCVCVIDIQRVLLKKEYNIQKFIDCAKQ